MDSIIKKAKEALSDHPILYGAAKAVFGRVSQYQERKEIEHKQQVFQENAREVLRLFVTCMEEGHGKDTAAEIRSSDHNDQCVFEYAGIRSRDHVRPAWDPSGIGLSASQRMPEDFLYRGHYGKYSGCRAPSGRIPPVLPGNRTGFRIHASGMR